MKTLEIISTELDMTPTIFLALFAVSAIVQALLIKKVIQSDKEIGHWPLMVNFVAIALMYAYHAAMPVAMAVSMTNSIFVMGLVIYWAIEKKQTNRRARFSLCKNAFMKFNRRIKKI